MAGNKGNTKAKGKEDKVKTSKSATQVNEDSEDAIDFAVLRKPIPTSITGFAQARKIFDLATEELKDLLSNECDLLYECKVCRNIFRSLANFISHKRVYCKEKFNATLHGHFVTSTSTTDEMLRITRVETEYQDTFKSKKDTDTKDPEENDDRVQLSKDLTAVYEQIMKSKGVYANKDDPKVVLKKIPSSNVAVFQNLDYDEKQNDNMRTEVQEIDTLLSRDLAILGNDGKFIIDCSDKPMKLSDLENIIQISDDDETEDGSILKCKICDLQFSTRKTLKFHMKYKHLESRLVYPCPDCLEIFSTSWSVYRHLFKVHRKTAAQIRRLRESIQAKAFRMNNPPAYYEKRKNVKPPDAKKITEEERLDQENQAWMDNLEGDGEVPRCGGCGRTFERRAALAAHTHTCQPRSRALARRDRPDRTDRTDRADKKIEIQIRKDYNKTPFGLTILKPPEMTEVKAPSEKPPPTTTNEAKEPEEKPPEVVPKEEQEEEAKIDDEPPMDVDDDDDKSNGSGSPEKIEDIKQPEMLKPLTKLPFSLQAEKSNQAALKQRVYTDVDISKLRCKKCDSTHSSVYELYEHMAGHVNWLRYACKLCNFKHYSFEKLPEHVKVVHKLKGDSDFYYSTVKAIDGTEAMLISKCAEAEAADDTEANASPESRRPSRASSDSSRLSDDSSSSTTLKEVTTRKRRMHHNKRHAKKKKDTNDDGEDQKDSESIVTKAMKSIILGDSNCSSNDKAFDENSSDMDDIEDKIKRQIIGVPPTLSSRRPVRKRTKVHNEDFEYDLSNLLKKEAQGYRDSQVVVAPKTNQTSTAPKSNPPPNAPKPSQVNPTPKPYSAKKRTSVESSIENNQKCSGAMLLLSNKAVEKAAAHLRTSNFAVYSTSREHPRPNVFARPMLPRIISRGDKSSPKKDSTEETKTVFSPNKVPKTEMGISDKSLETNDEAPITDENTSSIKTSEKNCSIIDENDSLKVSKDNSKLSNDNKIPEDSNTTYTSTKSTQGNDTKQSIEENGCEEMSNTKIVPIKFSSKSLDLMKNPIINKNINEFSKAGMKTKILVIKPINRNKDKSRPNDSPLKFQTIKLKDPSKGSSGVDKQSDQIMVVQVPKVPHTNMSKPVACTARTSSDLIEEKICDENEAVQTVEHECRNLIELKLDEEHLSLLNNKDIQSDSQVETKAEYGEDSEVKISNAADEITESGVSVALT